MAKLNSLQFMPQVVCQRLDVKCFFPCFNNDFGRAFALYMWTVILTFPLCFIYSFPWEILSGLQDAVDCPWDFADCQHDPIHSPLNPISISYTDHPCVFHFFFALGNHIWSVVLLHQTVYVIMCTVRSIQEESAISHLHDYGQSRCLLQHFVCVFATHFSTWSPLLKCDVH